LSLKAATNTHPIRGCDVSYRVAGATDAAEIGKKTNVQVMDVKENRNLSHRAEPEQKPCSIQHVPDVIFEVRETHPQRWLRYRGHRWRHNWFWHPGSLTVDAPG
jgi:hypothetical protein